MRTAQYPFFCFALFAIPASSAVKNPKIWIKPPQVFFFEFKAHVKALGAPNLTYGEGRLQGARARAAAFPLKEKIIQAQEFYLSGDGASAQKIFGEISALAHSADWRSEQRRIIFYSFLRRAQDENSPEKRKSLLLSAGNLVLWDFGPGGAFGPGDSDRQLFPPPLLEELDGLRASRSVLSVQWKKIFPHHEAILLNGKEVRRESAAQIPEGSYRVSAFSSSHAPWSKILPLSQLLAHPVKAAPLVKGYCGSLQIKEEWAGGNIFLFPPSDCEKDIVFSKAWEESLKKRRIPLKAENPKQLPQAKTPKWLWALGSGAAAVGLVVLFSALSESSPEAPPSQSSYHY